MFLKLSVLVLLGSWLEVRATPAHIMDSIEPERFLGKWWIDSFSQAIYGDADRCAHVVVKKEGDKWIVAAEYIAEDGELVQMTVDVKEDSRHPSRFFLEVGGETIMEIAVVGTNYENWAVIWAKSGSASSYNVATRTPNMEDKFHDPIQKVLDKANLKKVNFIRVPNEDCTKKDTI